MRSWQRVLVGLLAAVAVAGAQEDWGAALSDPDPRARARAARNLGDSPDGFRRIDLLGPLVQDEIEEVRAATVLALIKMRVVEAQPLLIEATADLSPRVQALAVDGLVDFYIPEYVQLGRMASIRAVADSLKGRFSKPTPLAVAAYVDVNPAVVEAIGQVVTSGRSEQARANAARAVGILMGREALDALVDGVRSGSATITLESVLSIKKLREPSAGPNIVFLLRDLDPALLEAVIQTVGQLRTPEAVPELVRIVQETDRSRLRIEALIALAKIPGNGQRELFISYFRHRDDRLRAAAAEGLARIGSAEDLPMLAQLSKTDKSTRARLSLAFASVMLGDHVQLAHLVEGLNSRAHRLEARPLIVELARDPAVLAKLYVPMSTGTVPQRRHLAYVMAQSGTEESLPYLENLTKDGNDDVASAAIEALRVLRARL